MISSIGIDRSQHVRNGGHGHQPRALVEQFVELIEPQQSVVVDRDEAQHGPGPRGQLLPGDDVGVVLHLGQQDFVAGAQVGVAPTAGDQVDAFGRAVREDHFLARLGADEGLHLQPGLLEQIGALIAQPVNAAMDVGIVLFVDVDQRLDHLPRPLRGGRVVEIDQRHVVVQPGGQDRKIGPQPGHVERIGRGPLAPPDLPSRRLAVMILAPPALGGGPASGE